MFACNSLPVLNKIHISNKISLNYALQTGLATDFLLTSQEKADMQINQLCSDILHFLSKCTKLCVCLCVHAHVQRPCKRAIKTLRLHSN